MVISNLPNGLNVTTNILNVELHCHNIFSNYRNKSSRIPFDCGISLPEQLEEALNKKIDALFVTNHNTLDGYNQILEYQKNHSKFSNIKIYRAEEVTTDTKGHVLSYGITKEIKPEMTIEETLDEIKRQSAISCAAHPFSVTNGVRQKARMCDMIESFNSNNIDTFSNIVADKFAKENNLTSVAGSDAHITSTIGRCTNEIESENNLDSILHALKHGKIKIGAAEYASKSEIYQHAHYILSSSRQMLLEYATEHYPQIHHIMKGALDNYLSHPDKCFWQTLGSFTLFLTKRASKKVNIKGHDPKVFENRSWRKLISMSLTPY